MNFIRNLFKERNRYELVKGYNGITKIVQFWVEKNGGIIFDSIGCEDHARKYYNFYVSGKPLNENKIIERAIVIQ